MLVHFHLLAMLRKAVGLDPSLVVICLGIERKPLMCSEHASTTTQKPAQIGQLHLKTTETTMEFIVMLSELIHKVNTF